jgi:alpha-beta hydrolase superfamily lysophospholipase
MTQTTEVATYADFHPPTGLRTRGTVVVVPGRGETPGTYRRLGARLAADAYRVRVVAAPAIDPADVPGSLDALAAELSAAVEEDAARPLVLLGADSGAVAAAALLARGDRLAAWWPEAVVLAAPPARAAAAADRDAELDLRTACPVHRGVLAETGGEGSLADPLPDALLDTAYVEQVGVPQLVLVGDADPLADRAALAAAVAASPRARLSVVRGAHHDVLNDVQHRSVAAEVVTFLEALRDELVPVIAVESSAW